MILFAFDRDVASYSFCIMLRSTSTSEKFHGIFTHPGLFCRPLFVFATLHRILTYLNSSLSFVLATLHGIVTRLNSSLSFVLATLHRILAHLNSSLSFVFATLHRILTHLNGSLLFVFVTLHKIFYISYCIPVLFVYGTFTQLLRHVTISVLLVCVCCWCSRISPTLSHIRYSRFSTY